MTPKAAEGAAFEKNSRPDAWTIMDSVALDIEDHAFGDAHGESFNQDKSNGSLPFCVD